MDSVTSNRSGTRSKPPFWSGKPMGFVSKTRATHGVTIGISSPMTRKFRVNPEFRSERPVFLTFPLFFFEKNLFFCPLFKKKYKNEQKP